LARMNANTNVLPRFTRSLLPAGLLLRPAR
jgi:hypothetical protein